MPEQKPQLQPPAAEKTQLALEYCSKLEYAFAVRPPVDAPSRHRWEVHFKKDLYALIKELGAARFNELPAFAMGCIWEHNRSRYADAAPFDVEAITPADNDHAAMKGPRRLRYKASGDGPIPEAHLRSVWWDSFRLEAIQFSQGAALEAAQPPVDDGESEVDDGAGVADGTEISAPADQPVPTADTTSAASMGRRMRPRGPAAVHGTEVPAPIATPSTVSKKASGKRKAGAGSSARGSTRKQRDGLLGLNDVQAQEIAYAFVAHPRPCEACVGRNQQCRINPLLKSSCEACSKRKERCSNAFDIKKDHVLACYLGFVYWKMLSEPDVYAEPTFGPKNHPSPLLTRETFEWFTILFDAHKKGKKAVPKSRAASAVPKDQPEVGLRPTRGQPAGPSREDQEPAPEPAARKASVRVYGGTRSRSASRPPSPGSSTLRETPLSIGTSPPPSPSARSTPSPTGLRIPDGGTEGIVSSKLSRKRKEHRLEASSSTRTGGKGGSTSQRNWKVKAVSVSLPDDETSLPEDELTIPLANVEREHDDAFDGEASDFGRDASGFTSSSAPQSDCEMSEIGDILAQFGTEMGEVGGGTSEVGDNGSEADEAHRDVVVARPTEDTSLEVLPGRVPTPGSRSRRHATLHMNAADKVDSPSVKKISSPPSRPHSPLPLRRLPLSVPEVIGTWRNLPRVAKPKRNGRYRIIPPPPPLPSLAPADDPTVPMMPERDAKEISDEHRLDMPNPARPHTPLGSTFFFSEPIHAMVQDSRERYEAVASMSHTLERNSALLSQKAAVILGRHGELEQRIKSSAAWKDAMRPLLDHSGAIHKDLNEVVEVLANLHSVVAEISDAFKVVPPVPANWIALVEILETGRRLRELHRYMWEKLDEFQANAQPLRDQYSSLRIDLHDAWDRFDSILQDVDDQMQPLVFNIAEKFTEAVAKLERRVALLDGGAADVARGPDAPGPRTANLGDVVVALTTLTARVTTLEDRPTAATPEAIEQHIAKYLGQFGVTEGILRSLGTDLYHAPGPGPTGGSISAATGLTGAFNHAWSGPPVASSSMASGTRGTGYDIPSVTSTLTPYPSAMDAGPSAAANMAPSRRGNSSRALSTAGGHGGDSKAQDRNTRG
ncbi:hypothetical protein LXA43DRAFT_1057649 [Ganoderma leucocontextum]|nr:hypothetical protein LXA43DRAFT_1057649 [Ganoderma leucocontextum]